MTFSLIVPVYNVQPYLRECLDSLCGQTFKDWEAICIDDGSFDGSGQVLDDYAKHDKRIVVLHQENGGVSVARNRGLALAKGEYIGFVDADDCLDRGWLQTVFGYVAAHSCDLYRFRFTQVDEHYHPVQDVQCRDDHLCECYQGRSECIPKVLELVFDGGFSFLYFMRKEIVDGVFFPPGIWMHEDCLFFAKLAMRINSFCRCYYSGYLYRTRGSSACARSRQTDGMEYFVVAAHLLNIYADNVRLFHEMGIVQNAFDVFSIAIFRRLGVCVERCLSRSVQGNAKEMILRVCELLQKSPFGNPPSRFRSRAERKCYWTVTHAKFVYRVRLAIRLKRLIRKSIRRIGRQ